MKPGRNDPCHCGSGKKYKKCCLEKDEVEDRKQAQAAIEAAEAVRLAEEAARQAKREQAEREAEEWHQNHPRAATTPEPEAEADPNEPDWPPLAEEDQRLLDAWWNEVGPVYLGKKKQNERAGWLLERTLAFLEQQPRLYRYLYLHDEFLFELGAYLGREGRAADFIGLLQRLRREQPDAYQQCCGYYDRDIIAYLICTGRREEIPAYFDLFQQQPAKASEQLEQVIDWLAWRGLESELRALFEPSGPVGESQQVMADYYGQSWLTYVAMLPCLEAGDDSRAAMDNVIQAASAFGYQDDLYLNPDSLRRQVRMASLAPAEAGLDLKKSKGEWFYHDASWSFTGWLRRHKGLTWPSARLLARSLLDYWRSTEKKPGNDPFRLEVPQFDQYLAGRCRDFFWLDGVRLMSTMQAFVYFNDYLAAQGYLNQDRVCRLRSDCARLFDEARPGVDPADPGYQVFPTFDRMVAGVWPEAPDQARDG